MEHLQGLHQSGMTVIISSHDVERMWMWADSFIIMKDGKVLCEGTPEEVFQKADIIQNSGIAIPILYQVYLYLRKKGLVNQRDKIPKTVREMDQLIDIWMGKI
jgi:cobalt/nickel transport system ATP-binding protein